MTLFDIKWGRWSRNQKNVSIFQIFSGIFSLFIFLKTKECWSSDISFSAFPEIKKLSAAMALAEFAKMKDFVTCNKEWHTYRFITFLDVFFIFGVKSSVTMKNRLNVKIL